MALRLDPNLADSHAATGAALRSKGDFKEGLSACENALRLVRRYDDAISHFELAAGAMQSDFTAASFISQCYKAKGDTERMRRAARMTMDRIEKIVASEPGHSRAIGMGVCMLADLDEKRARQRVGDKSPPSRSGKYQFSLQSCLCNGLAGRL